jgi:hypothetical protein
MITYTNITRYDNLPWQEYVKLPGYSFSWLKRENHGHVSEFKPTDKMKLGSLVDALLTSPDTVTAADIASENFRAAVKIASQIKCKFGFALPSLKSQVSYTGTANFKGIALPVKGRLDWLLEGYAVTDLKVTDAVDVATLVRFMKYDDQMFNYCGLAGLDVAYILAYSKKLRMPLDPFVIKKPATSEFWEEKILKFGSA